MANRTEKVMEYVNSIFDRIGGAESKRISYVHSYGVSHCCALLAVKRGLNLELAAIIGLLHDLYTCKTGISALHSHNGAEMLRVAFKYELAGIFTDGEQTVIKSAVFHHSDKDHVHGRYDELLKDADILQHLPFDEPYKRINGLRLAAVMRELSLTAPDIDILPEKEPKNKKFDRSRLGDIA